MSYSIYIGEAALDVPKQEYIEKYDENTLGIRVNELTLDDAPSFPGDEMTGKTNGRHPGYSQWGEFCKLTGLHNMFFSKEHGIMRRHPGTHLLSLKHLDKIKDSRLKWEKEHPGAVPRFHDYNWAWTHNTEEYDPQFDGIFARLIWLEFWVDWALKNCKVPAIYNH